MIVKIFHRVRKDGKLLYRTYSDKGLKIQKVGTGEIYDEAIYLEGKNYEYVELDLPVIVV